MSYGVSAYGSGAFAAYLASSSETPVTPPVVLPTPDPLKMQTVTYKSVSDLAYAKFEGCAAIGEEEFCALNQFIDDWHREFYERFFWPKRTTIQQRAFRLTWDAATAYAAKSEVFFWGTRKYYLALKDTIAGQAPATLSGTEWTLNMDYWAEALASYEDSAETWLSTTAYVQGDIVFQPDNGLYYMCHTAHTNQEPPNVSYWGELVSFIRDIDYSGGNQGTQDEIGDVKDVWPDNPYNIQVQEHIMFDLTDLGVIVWGDEPLVWVQFRPPATDFVFKEIWVSGNAYSIGDIVYYSTDGHIYTCLQATDSIAPGNASYWTQKPFPRELKRPVAHAAYAELLKLDGQMDKWRQEIREAERQLHREYDRIERQQRQNKQLRVRTRRQ